jgi:hypothetical protein
MPGAITSLFQAVEPVAEESPLVAAVALYVIGPFPSANAMLQEFPTGQVKADPFMVPEMVSAKPCGSEAKRFSVAEPIHQPLLPAWEQATAPLTVGG